MTLSIILLTLSVMIDHCHSNPDYKDVQDLATRIFKPVQRGQYSQVRMSESDIPLDYLEALDQDYDEDLSTVPTMNCNEDQAKPQVPQIPVIQADTIYNSNFKEVCT